jgi:hypothetical protein
MSIAVDLIELGRVLERFDYAYLTTTDAAGRPHVVAVFPIVERGHAQPTRTIRRLTTSLT